MLKLVAPAMSIEWRFAKVLISFIGMLIVPSEPLRLSPQQSTVVAKRPHTTPNPMDRSRSPETLVAIVKIPYGRESP
jgi:hypothetical protein